MNYDKDMTLAIATILDDNKGEDIVILDVRGQSNLTDFIVIATGLNDRHAAALADHVEHELFKSGVVVHHKEGHRAGDWVVLDYVDVIVHVFNEEKRRYYDLEKLWVDAARIEPKFLKVN